jgi:hypothetical protein
MLLPWAAFNRSDHPHSTSDTGRFAVTIPAPPTGQAAVYRLQTSVPRSARNAKLFPSFTLPRAVELRR